MHDLSLGTTERVSVSSTGVEATGSENQGPGYLSADGRFVVFMSTSSVLLPPGEDTNGKSDVFLHDRVSKTTTRVSLDSSGGQFTQHSFWPAISNDGSVVAWTGENGPYVRDLTTGVTQHVHTNFDGQPSALSGNGLFVAFPTGDNILPTDTNDADDTYVYDRVTQTYELASVATDGTQGTAASRSPSLNADGTKVAFMSFASSLVPGDTNSSSDVFVRDLAGDTTTRVSVAADGAESNAGSGRASISGDGESVAFYSDGSNLVAGDTNSTTDVFVRGPSAPSAAPDVPVSLGQFEADGTTAIPVGGTTDGTTIVLKGMVSDPHGGQVRLEVELKPVETAFDGTALVQAPPSPLAPRPR